MSLLNGNNRAVPDVPFYMSDALQEFMGAATGNISEAMLAAEVAVPGLVSQLGGMSASIATHTVTVGMASGNDATWFSGAWTAYGYNNGYIGHDDTAAHVAFGDMSPLTVNVGGEVLPIECFDGLFDSSNTPFEGAILTGSLSGSGNYQMAVLFPDMPPCVFISESSGIWHEYAGYAHHTLAESMKAFHMQTVGIAIVVQPITIYEAGATGVYTKNLAPKGATNALYFIDPLQFDTTGQIKAFMDIPHRDAEAPLFTEMVPKPPANYYPGTHAYVDGEWVPK